MTLFSKSCKRRSKVDTFPDQLAGRFAALPIPPDDNDWLDVRRRARRARRPRRRITVAVLAAALVVAVATPALGLQRVVVDWFSAEPAPERVQVDFDQLSVGAPRDDWGPQVVPNSARKVMESEIGGQRRTLWVAPTKKGGYCFLWSNYLGGCAADPKSPIPDRAGPNDVRTALLGVSSVFTGNRSILIVAGGHLHPDLRDDLDDLTLEFADGAATRVPFVWVSAPIDAGFYIYEIPADHRRVGHQATAIVARDADGRVLARQTFELIRPENVMHSVRLPDGQETEVPPNAVLEQARKLVDFESQIGGRVALWLIPRDDGRYCYAYNRGGGCPLGPLDRTMIGGVQGGSTVLFVGQVRPLVAAVEFHYEDEQVERLMPVEVDRLTPAQGFLLYEIPAAHYPQGRRLEAAVALDANGRELDRQQIDTHMIGVYPCEKPVDVGKGVMACR
jgi:hypothetical protein